ncbi:delta-60 repeat domain-containing protein [Pseudomonas sp. R4-75]|uniref:delta-60 repeat domain-containing protein n=1 Tax=Pseudomonas sp. R4-75 TaxID=2817404 RepID=UPI003DA8009F
MNKSTTSTDPRNAGGIDLSFGKEGFVEGTSGDSVRAITEHLGAIVYAEWSGDDIRLCRLHADGSVDSNFGQNGAVRWRFESGQRAAPEQLISQPDGKILLLGRTIDDRDPFIWRAAVSRFHPNGSPDLIFGTPILPYPYDPEEVSLTTHVPVFAQQTDGKLLITTGYSVIDAQGTSLFEAGRITRLESTGVTDSGFGVQGEIEVRINGQDTRIESVGLLSSEFDESIVVSARVDRIRNSSANQTMGVACFKLTGLLDQTFAAHGYWEALPGTTLSKMLIDSDKIMCLGTAEVPEGRALCLTRLTARGEADSRIQ